MADVRTWFAELPARQKIMMAVAAILLVAAVVYFLLPAKKVQYQQKAFVANAQTFKLEARDSTFIPPEKDANGNEWVYATVVANPDGSQRLAYLSKYRDDAANYLRTTPPTELDPEHALLKGGMLVSLPEQGAKWVPAQSREGLALVEKAMTNADGTQATIVFP